jgi:preprotein translocase subunit SecD
MAVDANVLILERVREELRSGKTVAGAIQTGYGRAFLAIFDSNLTTIISSVVLYQFGTGPIKGFAITLLIGIIANLFTAVFVTRLVYDTIMARRPIHKLSI